MNPRHHRWWTLDRHHGGPFPRRELRMTGTFSYVYRSRNTIAATMSISQLMK